MEKQVKKYVEIVAVFAFFVGATMLSTGSVFTDATYDTVYVQCKGGKEFNSYVQALPADLQCATRSEFQAWAEVFCADNPNPKTKKVGINRLGVKNHCEPATLEADAYGYGYGYGYGYAAHEYGYQSGYGYGYHSSVGYGYNTGVSYGYAIDASYGYAPRQTYGYVAQPAYGYQYGGYGYNWSVDTEEVSKK